MVAILGIIHVLNVFIYPGKELYHNVLHLVEKTGITLFLKRWKMIYKDIKDIKLTDLLEMQRQLDEEVVKPRDNGFVPRETCILDLTLALDDEFQEWLRELPDKYNFKVWKQKVWDREKEITEITDCLFFFLKLFDRGELYPLREFWCVDEAFDKFREDIEIKYLRKEILDFKKCIWDGEYGEAFYAWIHICKLRGFTKEDVIKTYLNKWKKNMHRIKEDWTK